MLTFLVAPVASFVLAAAPLPPRPDRYVNDRTGRLDATRMLRLNERLASFERETSTQIVVYVDKRMPPGTTLEEFAAAAMVEWGVGQKGKDNGALFLAFLDDRRMRIEVGYGLEGALPDARAHRIITEVVTPSFRKGDFTGGVEAAALEMLKAVQGEPYRGTGSTVAEGPRTLVAPNWVGWIVMALFSSFPLVIVAAVLHSAWKTAGEASQPVVRTIGRMGVFLWIACLLLAPFALWLRGPLPWLLLLLADGAIVAHAVVSFAQKKGFFARFRSLVSHAGLLVAATTLPLAVRAIGVPHQDIPTPLLVMGGALLVAMVAGTEGLRGSGGRSYSSSGSSWSRSSSSSSSRSSSSFSGGGGRSGGGGASGSW